MNIDNHCYEMMSLYRTMRRYQTQKIRNELAATAHVKSGLGFTVDLDEKDRKKIATEAEQIVKRVKAGDTDGIDEYSVDFILVAEEANRPFELMTKRLIKELEEMCKELPNWDWVESVRGASAYSAYGLVGECGNLSNYDGPAKVWKRMGLAPFNGKACSTWRTRGGLSADQWVEAGYSPKRCSVAYNIGKGLLNMNKAKYREKYDTAKANKLALESDDWPRGRCHNHAKRVMVKAYIKDFWATWRGHLQCEAQCGDAPQLVAV